MRCLRIVLFVFVLATSSCGGSQTARRQPVKLASLQTAAEKFDHIANTLVEAWNTRNPQVTKSLFSDNSEAFDRSFSDHAVGSDQIAALIAVVSSFGPTWEARQESQYIGLENGIAVEEMWNLKFGAVEFTQGHPMIDVDWLQTNGDIISKWTILYGLDNLEELGIPTTQKLEQARSLLSAYQSTWSSGNVQSVKDLYASDTVREDTVFMERQEGQNAIASFAGSFFDWYPGAQWDIVLAFGEGMGDTPVVGGLYTITVIDLNQQPCEVKVAVLLQTTENLITHEMLYYESQSLIQCGWAQ